MVVGVDSPTVEVAPGVLPPADVVGEELDAAVELLWIVSFNSSSTATLVSCVCLVFIFVVVFFPTGVLGLYTSSLSSWVVSNTDTLSVPVVPPSLTAFSKI